MPIVKGKRARRETAEEICIVIIGFLFVFCGSAMGAYSLDDVSVVGIQIWRMFARWVLICTLSRFLIYFCHVFLDVPFLVTLLQKVHTLRVGWVELKSNSLRVFANFRRGTRIRHVVGSLKEGNS